MTIKVILYKAETLTYTIKEGQTLLEVLNENSTKRGQLVDNKLTIFKDYTKVTSNNEEIDIETTKVKDGDIFNIDSK